MAVLVNKTEEPEIRTRMEDGARVGCVLPKVGVCMLTPEIKPKGMASINQSINQ